MLEHSGTTAGDRMTKHDKHGGLRMCVCVRPVCMCVLWTTAPRPERESPRPQQPLADADAPQQPLPDAEAADEPRWGSPSGGGSSFSRSKRPRTSV